MLAIFRGTAAAQGSPARGSAPWTHPSLSSKASFGFEGLLGMFFSPSSHSGRSGSDNNYLAWISFLNITGKPRNDFLHLHLLKFIPHVANKHNTIHINMYVRTSIIFYALFPFGLLLANFSIHPFSKLNFLSFRMVIHIGAIKCFVSYKKLDTLIWIVPKFE